MMGRPRTGAPSPATLRSRRRAERERRGIRVFKVEVDCADLDALVTAGLLPEIPSDEDIPKAIRKAIARVRNNQGKAG